MSPVIGHVSLPVAKATEPGKIFYSQKLAKMADEVTTIYYIIIIVINRKCVILLIQHMPEHNRY